MTKANTLPHRLQAGRIVAGFSQGELAEEIGCTRSALANYESGRSVLPWSVGSAWAARTGLNLRWLATGQTPQRPFIEPREMGADVAALKTEATAGTTFPEVYSRLIGHCAEKWHSRNSAADLVMRQLGGSVRSLSRLSWKDLRSMVQSLADVIEATTSDPQLVGTVNMLDAAITELKRRLVEKNPHLASLL